MKGFVLFLVVVLLAYTYAASTRAPVNYGNIVAHSGSSATGVVSDSTFGDGAFSAAGRRWCGLFSLFSGC
ncbi:hypothetical protein B5X24_HaOG209430 [Helicoverpa armigera]|uniref:Uncharacterized protein n=1 Tax=Helicoverpa armigera TaxID=29058 RepID=A0A2W1BEJ0_HELAM|nr:hypothetical protein B5X24_HaOG209430 [Helicoverpa armigera]